MFIHRFCFYEVVWRHSYDKVVNFVNSFVRVFLPVSAGTKTIKVDQEKLSYSRKQIFFGTFFVAHDVVAIVTVVVRARWSRSR